VSGVRAETASRRGDAGKHTDETKNPAPYEMARAVSGKDRFGGRHDCIDITNTCHANQALRSRRNDILMFGEAVAGFFRQPIDGPLFVVENPDVNP
jgi:hypothetical protein